MKHTPPSRISHAAAAISISLLAALLLAGCATTPDQRIEKNRDYFNSLPVADQARIRSGEINLGYTPNMVSLALGDPQRKLIRRTADGDTIVWLYTETTRSYERQRADIEGLNVTGAGGVRVVGGSAWLNVLQERELTRIRVEFQGGLVSAIEELPKPSAR